MKLEQEIGKGDYEESCQGKRARYNTPIEEMSMNMLNNEQVPAVRHLKITHRCYRHLRPHTSRWT